MRGTAHPEYIAEAELSDKNLKVIRGKIITVFKNNKEINPKDFWEWLKKDLLKQKTRIEGKQDKIPNQIIKLFEKIEDE